MPLPQDYDQRVYAGVLGKIIGVYLGRPFEGWSYEKILHRIGEIEYYVNDKVIAYYNAQGQEPPFMPLVVTDDDITGTFTFLRAMSDYGNSPDLSVEQIGDTWLNYIIENRTILWWGGVGNSTEHTAYINLKNGIPAPVSGSISQNGKITAEQIGAQIFIDGWAMIAPNDPEKAVEYARRAASVSHDGEAVYAAQVLAAMEAAAFTEPDINKLLDIGSSLIPQDSLVNQLIQDVRNWHAGEPDWHVTFKKIQKFYGYDRYGGNVHVIPNHAIVIMGLLYGDDDFQTALKVTNTAGWDTDCNSGNVGCLLGIKNGLRGLESGVDWRGPIRDRILMPTADGGRTITDAVRESRAVIQVGKALAGEPTISFEEPRYSFQFPGSVQGFVAEAGAELVTVENLVVDEQTGDRALGIQLVGGGAVITPTFIQPDEFAMEGYELIACPTLYSGQIINAGVSSSSECSVTPFIRYYQEDEHIEQLNGPSVELFHSNATATIEWKIPDTDGLPIVYVGFQMEAKTAGRVFLHYLDWNGTPSVTFTRPKVLTTQNRLQSWRRAWVDAVDVWQLFFPESFRISQNEGRGLLYQGTTEWTDYVATATISISSASAAGIAARIQGLCRYYGLLLKKGNTATLVKVLGREVVLAEAPFRWEQDCEYELRLEVTGFHIRAWINKTLLFDFEDHHHELYGGAAGFLIERGHLKSERLSISPCLVNT